MYMYILIVLVRAHTQLAMVGTPIHKLVEIHAVFFQGDERFCPGLYSRMLPSKPDVNKNCK
jgi:hypothetical protein